MSSIYVYNIKKKHRPHFRHMPSVDSDFITPDVDLWLEDPDLRKLKNKSVKDTPDTREVCFWNESE